MQKFGITNPIILMGAALLICTFMGFINGTLLTRLNLPHPFVSTLGMKNVLLGLALLITDSTPIGFMNKGVDSTLFLGSATIGDFPVSFIMVIIVYAIFHVFSHKDSTGPPDLLCWGVMQKRPVCLA